MRAMAFSDVSSYSYYGMGDVTSDSSMNVAQWFDYAPYGSVIATTNTGATKAGRQYIGQFTDDTGLSYLNARFYNSRQGQFTTEDPVFIGIGADERTAQVLEDPQQLNSYNYARNNFLVLKDPNGDFLPLLVAALEIGGEALMYGIEAYGAYDLGHSGGEVINAKYLFPNDYSSDKRNAAYFDFGVNLATFAAGPEAKAPFEKAVLTFGPTVASFAGNFANPSTNAQNQATQIYNSFQQFTASYPGLLPSIYQMVSTQINSSSVEDRYKAVQTYNVATGASTGSGGGGGGSSPSSNSLWVTPSGAVVTFGGQLVSAPPPSPEK
jgi:RHS repeat-associated protein